MIKLRQDGAINILIFPLIIVCLLMIGAVAFGVWAYGGRQDYKNNSDQKSAAAVSAALKVEDAKQQAIFAEESKSPLRTYVGPEAYGSVNVAFPKTWSAYVDDTGSSGNGIDGYFYPNHVPSITAQGQTFALRVEVLNQSLSAILQQYGDATQTGAIKVTPYALPKVKSVVGSRLQGTTSDNKIIDMVVFPLRDKTVQVWTEGTDFEQDFTTYILPNLSFSP